jgi:hypothetical protein
LSHRRNVWTISAIAFVVFAAVAGAIIDHYTHRLLKRVDSGFGYQPNPEGVRLFLGELAQPTFAEAGADAMKNATGRDTFLYRAVDIAHQRKYGTPWRSWDQGSAGTCVSFAFALGEYTAEAVDHVAGKVKEPPAACATEPVYGGSRTAARIPPMERNNGGDGSYGGAAARWLTGRCTDTTLGGVLYRQQYGSFDLTKYSIPLSRDWGRNGVPLELAREANKRKAKCVQVQTWQELCAAIERGTPVAICSQVGYGPTPRVRDSDGALSRGSSWSHAMLVWGVRHKHNGSPDDMGLIQNSWNTNWVSGPKWPDDQPDGSFWARRRDIEAALQQGGDSWAIGTSYEWRDLQNADWGLAL